MAYSKQTWVNGDIITADKLNHMEDGIENIGGNILEIGSRDEGSKMILDKTWNQIKNAIPNCVFIKDVDGLFQKGIVAHVGYSSASSYTVTIYTDMYYNIFVAESPDDYPSHDFD